MAEAFDPYHIWLAIPAEEQPPHHYRLLGVRPFETNADVLESAVDQRMSHLRSFQTGKHSAESQKLLNELAAARVCLLNPQKRQAYDKALRAKLAAEKPPAAPAPPVAPAKPLAKAQPLKATTAAPAVQAPSPLGFDPLEQAAARRGSKKRVASTSPAIYAVIGVGLLAAVAVAWIAIGGSGTDDRPIATRNVPAPPKPTDFGSAQVDQPAPVQPATAPPTRKGKPAAAEDDLRPSDDVAESGSVEEDLPGATEPSDDEADEMAVAGSDEAGAAEPATDDRAEAPSADQLAAAVTEIQHVLRDDYTAAKKPAEKTALAEKLLGLVTESSEASERFALLTEARRLAILAGSPTLAFQAADAQAESFAVDRFELLAKTADELAARELSSVSRKELVEAIEPLVDAALAAGQFAPGRRLAAVGVSTGRKVNMPDAVKTLARRGKELAAGEKMAANADEARTQLEKDPGDAKANETLGKYLCLYRGDWPASLPRLVRAENPALRAAAELETAADPSPGAMVKLGDAWWDLAEHDGVDAGRMRGRAGYWYQQAVSDLTGLTKTRVEKRLGEIGDAGPGLPAPLAGRKVAGKSIDLLAMADPARENLQDSWHKTPDGLKCEKKKTPLQIPLTIAGDYTLHVEFTRTFGTDCVAVIFPVLEKQTALFISGFDGAVIGLSYVDGKELRENATTIRPSILENGKRYALDLTIRRVKDHVSIRAMLDDKAIVAWQGAATSLGNWPNWALPRNDTIGIAANDPTVFHKATLKMLSGSATLLDGVGAKPAIDRSGPASESTRQLNDSSGGVTADKLVVWNCHNNIDKDRGMLSCNVELRKADKVVWSKKGIKLAWSKDEEPPTTIPLPKIPFDSLRVASETFQNFGPALCEVEIFRGDTNIARGKPVAASAFYSSPPFPPAAVVDGIRNSAQLHVGYWLAPNHQPGWVEVQFAPGSPRVTQQQADGIITLLARDAEIHGSMARYDEGNDSIGTWRDQHDWMSWAVIAKKSGQFDVSITMGCLNGHGGSRYSVTAGKHALDGVTKDSGVWTSMVTERLGTVRLLAGKPTAVELRALTKTGDAVMNVRSIVLTPVQ